MEYVLVANAKAKELYYTGYAPFTFFGALVPEFGGDIKKAVVFENKKEATKAAKKIGGCEPKAIETRKEEYRVKNLNMESAIKRYNDIMFSLALEHMTIGTDYSEDTEGFGIREMVEECEYWLSTYYESGHARADMRYSDDPEERKAWRSEKGKLERFINTYSKFT